MRAAEADFPRSGDHGASLASLCPHLPSRLMPSAGSFRSKGGEPRGSRAPVGIELTGWPTGFGGISIEIADEVTDDIHVVPLMTT